MDHSSEEYQRYGQLLPSYYPHLNGLIKDINSTFPNVDKPRLVELGAGSGEIVSALAELKTMECFAIDMSQDAFGNLAPSITPLRTSISKARISSPMHAIHSKDLTVDMYKFPEMLQIIEPWVIHNTLFMFTYFIDSPDSWRTNYVAQNAGWKVVREAKWTPIGGEVDKDWYPQFPATRNVVLFQRVTNK